MKRKLLSAIILSIFAAGCAGSGSAGHSVPAPTAGGAEVRSGKPLVTLRGEAIYWSDLRLQLLEAAGGQVLVDHIIYVEASRRLARQDLKITDEDIDRERDLMLSALADDPNDAHRLLAQLRLRRGLGDARYQALLRRNAILRKLIQPQVQVGEEQVRLTYDVTYGPKWAVRLILVSTAPEATTLARRAAAGEDFAELARQHSKDASRDVGGWIPALSDRDPTYPTALRTVLTNLQPGEVSQPVALDQGIAILKCEARIPAQPIQWDQVQADLHQRVRRQVERVLMARLARTLLDEADVTVLDPTLAQSWQQARQEAQQQQQQQQQ